jgi:hypothetical protein
MDRLDLSPDFPGGGLPDGPPGAPPRPAIGVEADSSYVLGFPIHVAVTVSADTLGGAFPALPEVSWRDGNGAIGLRLRVPPAAPALNRAVSAPPLSMEAEATPQFRLDMGVRRRFLADLAEVIPERFPPGAYQAVLRYGTTRAAARSAEFRLVLRSPTAEEAGELARLRPELKRAGGWGRWVYLPPPPGRSVTRPRDPSDPARFNRMMRFLFQGPEPTRDIPFSALDVLGSFYHPESVLLMYELLAMRDPARFARQTARLRKDLPAMSYWIDDIEGGRGEISWERSTRSTPPSEEQP